MKTRILKVKPINILIEYKIRGRFYSDEIVNTSVTFMLFFEEITTSENGLIYHELDIDMFRKSIDKYLHKQEIKSQGRVFLKHNTIIEGKCHFMSVNIIKVGVSEDQFITIQRNIEIDNLIKN